MLNKRFTNNKFKDDSEIKIPKFDLIDSDFPDLFVANNNSNNNNNNNSNNSKKYSTIVTTDIINTPSIKEKKIHVPPGWVQYVYNKHNNQNYPFVITTGEKTTSEKAFLESKNDIYYIPSIIASLNKKWDKYKTNYDNLNGPGAYDEMYFSEPIYNSDEYDSEPEPDLDDQEYNDTQDDYDYDYWDFKKH